MISSIGYRLRANRLDVRGPLADALPAGLQDSAPRAAQLSLHARVAGLSVDGWADPSLRQLWGPRGAAYLVAAADWAVFTVGRLPRSAPDELLAVADQVVARLGADEVDPALVMPSLGRDVLEIRELARSGRLAVRWDASRITVRVVPAPSMDPVAAQRELGRRFIRVFGPTDVRAFTAWARIPRADAIATWRELADELVPVDGGHLLASYRHLWSDDHEVTGARLLPGEDPLLRLDREVLVPDPAHRATLFPRHPTGVLRGAILVDGAIRGWWDRQGTRVHLHPFDGTSVAEATAEAWTLPVPGGVTSVD
ncbi:MAG TPA: crosslink repair DNA glycosylase YcaQ family protein [Pseudonocardiaceae bacterium]|jgi:hypothetical protein